MPTNLCEPMCCRRNLLLGPLDRCQQTDFFAFETGLLQAKGFAREDFSITQILRVPTPLYVCSRYAVRYLATS